MIANMAEVVPIVPRFERCYCLGITRDQALAAIAEFGCTSIEELRARTGACAGCGSCRPELQQLLHDVAADRAETPP
jgi:nitrite reductase (NADH) large subunit